MSSTTRLALPTTSIAQQGRSKAAWNQSRSLERADFFTMGYTGRPLVEILDTLIGRGVRTLADIRQNAVSMYRPELSRTNLRSAVEARGLHYLHLPELGVPRDIRAKSITSGSRDVIWSWYDEFVARPYASRNLHRFFNGLEHPVVFLCVEIDLCECHRHRLGVALEACGLRGFDL